MIQGRNKKSLFPQRETGFLSKR